MSWEKVKIKDFAEVITGGTPSTSKKEYWDNGDIPWLNSGELNQGLILSSSNFITKPGLENSAAKLMPPNTVLIALTGATTGVTGYLGIEACANQSVTGVIPSDKHHPRFLYYYLGSIRNRILNDSYGGAQKHISQGYVKDICVPLPPLPIQQKIAAILDQADALRKKDQQLLAKYDELLQAVFYDMFGDPVKNEKGWELKKLIDVCTKITDGTHDTPQRLKEGVKFITGKHIRPNHIDFDNSDYVTEDVHKEIYRRCNPEYGDILYTNIGVNLATAAMNTVNYEFSMKNVALLKPDKKVLSGLFLSNCLNNERVKSKIISFSGIGGAQQFLSLSQIKSLQLIIPPYDIQNQFTSIANNIYKQKEQVKQQLQQSEALFQALLQRAFKGELVK